MKHLMHIERPVHLGGWRLWPFRRRFGGRWYSVAPLSLLRFTQFVEAAARLGAPTIQLLMSSPRLYILPLAPLFLATLPRRKDLSNSTDEQAAALLVAVAECNDLDYIFEQMAGGKKDEGEADEGKEPPGDWSLIDAIDFLVEMRPVYTHEQVKSMAAQEFFAIMECIKRKIDARKPPAEGEDEDGYREVTPAELYAMAEEKEKREAANG